MAATAALLAIATTCIALLTGECGATGKRDCAVFSVPCMVCAPDVSKVTVAPYYGGHDYDGSAGGGQQTTYWPPYSAGGRSSVGLGSGSERGPFGPPGPGDGALEPIGGSRPYSQGSSPWGKDMLNNDGTFKQPSEQSYISDSSSSGSGQYPSGSSSSKYGDVGPDDSDGPLSQGGFSAHGSTRYPSGTAPGSPDDSLRPSGSYSTSGSTTHGSGSSPYPSSPDRTDSDLGAPFDRPFGADADSGFYSHRSGGQPPSPHSSSGASEDGTMKSPSESGSYPNGFNKYPSYSSSSEYSGSGGPYNNPSGAHSTSISYSDASAGQYPGHAGVNADGNMNYPTAPQKTSGPYPHGSGEYPSYSKSSENTSPGGPYSHPSGAISSSSSFSSGLAGQYSSPQPLHGYTGANADGNLMHPSGSSMISGSHPYGTGKYPSYSTSSEYASPGGPYNHPSGSLSTSGSFSHESAGKYPSPQTPYGDTGASGDRSIIHPSGSYPHGPGKYPSYSTSSEYASPGGPYSHPSGALSTSGSFSSHGLSGQYPSPQHGGTGFSADGSITNPSGSLTTSGSYPHGTGKYPSFSSSSEYANPDGSIKYPSGAKSTSGSYSYGSTGQYGDGSPQSPPGHHGFNADGTVTHPYGSGPAPQGSDRFPFTSYSSQYERSSPKNPFKLPSGSYSTSSSYSGGDTRYPTHPSDPAFSAGLNPDGTLKQSGPHTESSSSSYGSAQYPYEPPFPGYDVKSEGTMSLPSGSQSASGSYSYGSDKYPSHPFTTGTNSLNPDGSFKQQPGGHPTSGSNYPGSAQFPYNPSSPGYGAMKSDGTFSGTGPNYGYGFGNPKTMTAGDYPFNGRPTDPRHPASSSSGALEFDRDGNAIYPSASGDGSGGYSANQYDYGTPFYGYSKSGDPKTYDGKQVPPGIAMDGYVNSHSPSGGSSVVRGGDGRAYDPKTGLPLYPVAGNSQGGSSVDSKYGMGSSNSGKSDYDYLIPVGSNGKHPPPLYINPRYLDSYCGCTMPHDKPKPGLDYGDVHASYGAHLDVAKGKGAKSPVYDGEASDGAASAAIVDDGGLKSGAVYLESKDSFKTTFDELAESDIAAVAGSDTAAGLGGMPGYGADRMAGGAFGLGGGPSAENAMKSKGGFSLGGGGGFRGSTSMSRPQPPPASPPMYTEGGYEDQYNDAVQAEYKAPEVEAQATQNKR